MKNNYTATTTGLTMISLLFEMLVWVWGGFPCTTNENRCLDSLFIIQILVLLGIVTLVVYVSKENRLAKKISLLIISLLTIHDLKLLTVSIFNRMYSNAEVSSFVFLLIFSLPPLILYFSANYFLLKSLRKN